VEGEEVVGKCRRVGLARREEEEGVRGVRRGEWRIPEAVCDEGQRERQRRSEGEGEGGEGKRTRERKGTNPSTRPKLSSWAFPLVWSCRSEVPAVISKRKTKRRKIAS